MIAHATWWIMVFGGLSFVAAFVYAIVSILQWRQTRELFELSERPSLGIKFKSMETDKHGQIRMHFTVKNFGNGPARRASVSNVLNVWEFMRLDYPCPEPKRLPEIKGIDSRVVIPANGYIGTITDPISPDEFQGILNGQQMLFVWITVNYEGLVGAKFFIEFYGRYNVSTGAFDSCREHNDGN